MNDEIQVLDTDAPVEEETYTPYERINFENGTLVSLGSVDSETGTLKMPVYSGKAPINATNLNHIEDGIKSLENYVFNTEDKINSIIESELDMTNTRIGNLNVNKLRVQNKLVIFDFESYATNFQQGYNLVGKIPNEYVPKSSGYHEGNLMYFPVMISGMNRIAFGRITSAGNVEVYSDTTNTSSQIGYVPTSLHIRIHTSWFTD